MNWNDLVWLGLGLGIGIGIGLGGRWRSRLTDADRAEPGSKEAESKEAGSQAEVVTVQSQSESLQPLQLAYQLASEMSQFKGGFLARASHELRSPLNGLIGMQQLILQDLCDSPEEEREFIAQANQAALKMVKVLDNVLAVARLQHGTTKLDLQPLQLAATLQAIYDLTYLQAADRNLKLRLTLPDPDFYILADPRRLQQVLLYLMDAPIAQMEEGGLQLSAHISVETGFAQIWIDSDRPLWLSEPIDRLQTVPTIETVPAIEMMSAIETVFPSPGLDLLTSQILIALMQGSLTVLASPAGNGQTRLQCSLPLVAPELVE